MVILRTPRLAKQNISQSAHEKRVIIIIITACAKCFHIHEVLVHTTPLKKARKEQTEKKILISPQSMDLMELRIYHVVSVYTLQVAYCNYFNACPTTVFKITQYNSCILRIPASVILCTIVIHF